jgi:prevent-host-death family protein
MEGLEMTYTLAMAADQGIQIAKDGVAEVSMTDARANLTQLIREVRYGGRSGAFTERGRRSAYVVPSEFYERAVRNAAILEELGGFATIPPDLPPEDHPEVVQRARIVYEALDEAEQRVDS